MNEKKSLVYKVKVNEFDFTFTQEEVDQVDVIQRSPTTFNLLKDGSSTNGVLIEKDTSAKKQIIQIKGDKYNVEIKDELDQVLDRMGFNAVASKQIKEIKAPMPGMVLEVAVAEGQQVLKGAKILILVAMKMENSILIQADATIKHIVVRAGDAVEKGQVLIELE